MHTLSMKWLPRRARVNLSQLSFGESNFYKLQAYRGGVVSRCVGTSASEPKRSKSAAEPKAALLDRVVDKLNTSIKNYPGEAIAVLFATDIGSIGAMYGFISLTGIEFSPEFALAFAASRPFRRFRLPLDLVVAAGVTKVFPSFSRVHLSDLANALPRRSNLSESNIVSTPSFFSKSMEKATKVIDDYGAAYMVGSRLAGVAVVCSLYALIKQGVDVMPLLASLGMERAGKSLGGYAAAVVFGSAIYPLTLGASGYIVPVVAKLRRGIMP
ncbi:hypothetical protein CCR75_008420 [Bremia lactucae]|uniref:Transmembrane protein n=1 Tax=Bremia lactucae TaxID=4779 RepID=A0A976FDX9_BRELC|nr:hypothetical protein CCR75_008420 [Bremia lactucae]